MDFTVKQITPIEEGKEVVKRNIKSRGRGGGR
jgi:hypothetical protein